MTISTAPASADSREQGWEARHFGKPAAGWRRRAFTVIFESDTRAGRAFDVALLAAILVSVVVVMFDSVESVSARHGEMFEVVEWLFTLVFSAEYLARLVCADRPLRYARSFFGVVDLLSVAPTYLAFFFPELHALIDIRLLRMLRVFRILKVTAYMTEYSNLGQAIWASRRRIVVFIGTVFMIVVLLGTLMYVVEGAHNGFTSIPVSVYWAITTMTTVGFGDITPKTDLGRLIASFMMLLGWGTLAVPTGIVTAEMTARRMGRRDGAGPGSHEPAREDGQEGVQQGPRQAAREPLRAGADPAGQPPGTREAAPLACAQCGEDAHLSRARFCHACGGHLG